MKDLAYLEYTFVFEPSADTWQRGTDFETDLADFFAASGLQANVVNVVGGAAKRILYIQRMDKLNSMRVDEGQVAAQPMMKGPKEALKNMMKQAKRGGV